MRIVFPGFIFLSALALSCGAAMAQGGGGCPAGYHKTGEQVEETPDARITHAICDRNIKPKPLKPADKCAALRERAERDLEISKRNQEQAEAGQEEMKAWGEMNKEAQLETIKDAISYLGGEYAESAEPAEAALEKLVAKADKLAKRATDAKKAAARAKYVARLEATLTKMKPALGDVLLRKGVGTAVDVEEKWDVASSEMHLIFNHAVEGNNELKQIVGDPRFKSTFYDPEDTAPGADLIKTLGDKAVEKGAKLALKAKKFATFTGPGVRALSFVTDLAYDLTKNYLSAQRAVQWSDVAGQFARASASLQRQYKRSFDAYRACRAGGG
ncbi:MAG: hypothetical protein ABSD21_03610 [Rhizomicrobium sp.]|jgi:hypothetical protein